MYICQKYFVGCIFDNKMAFAVINTTNIGISTSTFFIHWQKYIQNCQKYLYILAEVYFYTLTNIHPDVFLPVIKMLCTQYLIYILYVLCIVVFLTVKCHFFGCKVTVLDVFMTEISYIDIKHLDR